MAVERFKKLAVTERDCRIEGKRFLSPLSSTVFLEHELVDAAKKGKQKNVLKN